MQCKHLSISELISDCLYGLVTVTAQSVFLNIFSITDKAQANYQNKMITYTQLHLSFVSQRKYWLIHSLRYFCS